MPAIRRRRAAIPTFSGAADDVSGALAWHAERLRALLVAGGAHPEVHKIRERMLFTVSEMQRLLERAGQPARLSRRITAVLSEDPALARRPTEAWPHSDRLDLLLLEVADQSYLALALETEARRAGETSPQTPLAQQLTELAARCRMSASLSERERDEIVDVLVSVRHERQSFGAHERARIGLRSRYMTKSAAVLAPLVTALLVPVVVSSDLPTAVILSTAAAGAVGSVVAALFRLREADTIRSIRAHNGLTLVQPLIGATSGVALLLLLRSPLLGLPGAESDATAWAALPLYGFLAGFSEPFFLGILQRITAAADATADAAAPAARDAAIRPPISRDETEELAFEPLPASSAQAQAADRHVGRETGARPAPTREQTIASPTQAGDLTDTAPH